MPILPVGAAPLAAPSGPTAVSTSKVSFGQALARTASGPAQTSAATTPQAPSRLVAAATEIERAQQRLDAVLAAARRGQTFTAQELIALQAQAYRVSQSIELAGKLVEQGAQSVKHAVNTQV